MLKKVWNEIRLFFTVDVALYVKEHLWAKILLALLCGFLIYLLLFCLFFGGVMLVGSRTFDMEFLHSTDQISQIEILYVGEDDNADPAEVDNITICVTIPAAQRDAFLSDLTAVTCRPTGFDSTPQIYGGAIRITYQNGDYEIFADYGILRLKQGEKDLLMRRLDEDELLQLLTAYGYQEPTA